MPQQGPPTEQMPTGSNTPVYQQQQQQQQAPTHSTNTNSFTTSVNNAGAPELAQSVALNTGVTAPSELADAVPASANGTGNYVLGESTDFTFGVQGQPDDLMDFTFDPITTPGNEDMLAAMQAIQNPTWWRTMMMPGSVLDRFFSLSHRTYFFAFRVASFGLLKSRDKTILARSEMAYRLMTIKPSSHRRRKCHSTLRPGLDDLSLPFNPSHAWSSAWAVAGKHIVSIFSKNHFFLAFC
jgi:hypothetical protein